MLLYGIAMAYGEIKHFDKCTITAYYKCTVTLLHNNTLSLLHISMSILGAQLSITSLITSNVLAMKAQ